MLVPHSQGALYANEVFQAITGGSAPADTLKVVAVATPADSVAGDPANSSYVTSSADLVIAAARLLWAVLPANVTLPISGLGHSFIDAYLDPDIGAWPQIRPALDAAMGGFQPQGQLLVTANWDPRYSGIDFRMLVNGRDTTTGLNPVTGLSTGAGWATYCTALPEGSMTTTYVPIVSTGVGWQRQ